jgi:hypothetical protein
LAFVHQQTLQIKLVNPTYFVLFVYLSYGGISIFKIVHFKHFLEYSKELAEPLGFTKPGLKNNAVEYRFFNVVHGPTKDLGGPRRSQMHSIVPIQATFTHWD